MDKWVVGVDLGGTKIEMGLIDPDNQIIERFKMPTNPDDGPQSVVERIADCVNRLQSKLPAQESIAALGICCPGPLDHEAGVLINPTHLPKFFNVPLRQMLADRLNMPISMEHDAKASGLGEFYYGAGRGSRNMVFTVIGTGVGSSIIINGKLYRGNRNFAGEVGHITIDRHGEPCSCGSRGCMETYTSGPWLARRYERLLERESQTLDAPITGQMVISKAQAGDPLAQSIMTEAGEVVGVAVAMMAMILDIELFVFGGGVSKCGDLLLGPARLTVPKYSFKTVSPHVKILVSELGEDGAILGCGWLARQALQ